MTQHIISASLGQSFVLRNGIFRPPAYRCCELGGGWTHWIKESVFQEAYGDLDERDMFGCEHPAHRIYQVHDHQAKLVRACPAMSRA